MGIYHEAAKVLQREAVRCQQLIDTAKTLEEIGSFEQLVDASKSAAAISNKEAEAAKEETAKAKAATAKAKADAEVVAQKAADQFDAIVADARKREESIISAASAKAEKMQSDALAATNAQQAALKSMTDKLAAKRDELQVVCDALAIKERDLTEQAEAAESRLAKVRAQIAKLTVA